MSAGDVERGVSCLSFTAVALWALGYPEQARQRSEAALTLARQVARPSIQALALHMAVWVARDRRDIEATHAQVKALIALCHEHELPFWLAWGQTSEGWMLTEQGDVEEGIRHMQESLAMLQAASAEGGLSDTLALLAEAYSKRGQIESGLALLAEALSCVAEKGERYYEAEIHRLRGELTLQLESQKAKGESKNQPPPLPPNPHVEMEQKAEGYFLKAIDTARRQRAKSFELRATMSLARLWQSQGKRQEAHRRLSAIYDWFTEGFDTRDLQEAKALLDGLNQETGDGHGLDRQAP
jgi:predicted ATPase